MISRRCKGTCDGPRVGVDERTNDAVRCENTELSADTCTDVATLNTIAFIAQVVHQLVICLDSARNLPSCLRHWRREPKRAFLLCVLCCDERQAVVARHSTCFPFFSVSQDSLQTRLA